MSSYPVSSSFDALQALTVAAAIARWALMGYAAVHDARTRTFPNALAAVFLAACAGEAFLSAAVDPYLVTADAGALSQGAFLPGEGFRALAQNGARALVACLALVGFEAGWRRARHESGLGLGDVKFLFALMLTGPVPAFASFVLGLAAMAVAGLATGRRALPLLPFIVVSYAVVALLRVAGLLAFEP